MVSAGSCNACGENFSRFQHKTFEDFKILVIHELDFIFAEDTILSPGEIEFFLVFGCAGT
jgi:hypothetical protein